MATIANALRALFAVLAGIGLYFLGDPDNWEPVIAIVAGGFAIGLGFLLAGLGVLRQKPVVGVWLLNGWTLALLAIGAGITVLLTLAAVEITHALSDLDKAQADAVGGAVIGALTTAAATAFMKGLEEGTGPLSVAARTRAAIQRKFVNAFPPGTRGFEAVWEKRAHGSPAINGWGFVARLRRAAAIAAG